MISGFTKRLEDILIKYGEPYSITLTCARYDIPLVIKPEQIATYQTTKENTTRISLASGEIYMVKDTKQTVERKIVEYRTQLLESAYLKLLQEIERLKNA